MEQQTADDYSLLNTFKKLIALRKAIKAISAGDIEIVPTGNKHILAYTRSTSDEKVIVLINFSKARIQNQLSVPILELLFSIHPKTTFNGILEAYDAVVCRIAN